MRGKEGSEKAAWGMSEGGFKDEKWKLWEKPFNRKTRQGASAINGEKD